MSTRRWTAASYTALQRAMGLQVTGTIPQALVSVTLHFAPRQGLSQNMRRYPTYGELHDHPQAADIAQGGEADKQTLLLGQTLSAAIRHPRQPSKPRRMWIDSICINQADMNEREISTG
ncbi:hypothetical protein B0T25DRAFT_268128 [Lasiosphaeria hispida]|uniref:Heterokaryon incompatibility domain-containing protein n=1 Tax=Lasiosphaeria hispida TaxID=260671 RepID=A0AAJ0HB59_9PEZI|nr:hypothetical protein B0T25DRAFT_268128 [Lasiosphaeria hispida]